MKRIMSSEKMILAAATEGELAMAEAVFVSTFSESPWLREGIAKGYYRAHTVTVGSLPRYVIIWHKSDQNQMLVNFCAQLNGGHCFDALVEAVAGIARHFKCASVQLVTARAALVRKLQEKNFKPFGVALELPL